MARLLPILFGQSDYYQRLGTVDGTTISSHGCYVTSFATLARACGKETDPVELNKFFTVNNLYLNGNLMYDGNLTKAFPDILYQKTIDFKRQQSDSTYTDIIPFDINFLRDLYKDPSAWAIVKIRLPRAPWTHFALVTGVNGTITIADPLTKKNEDYAQRYGDPVQSIIKVVVYKGTTAINYEEAVVAKQNEANANWNVALEILAALGVQADSNDKINTTLRGKEKIVSYITQIGELTKQVEDYKIKYEDELKRRIALNEANQIISGEDQDSSEAVLEAQHKANRLEEEMKTVADKLDVDVIPDRSIKDQILDEIVEMQNKLKEAEHPEIQLARKYFTILNKHFRLDEFFEKNDMKPIDLKDLGSKEVEEKLEFFFAQIVHELLKKPEVPTDAPVVDSPIVQSIKKKSILEVVIEKVLGSIFQK